MLLNLHFPIYTFTTLYFLLYLTGVAVVYRLIPRRWRPLALLLSSYFLYFNWNHRMTLLLLASTALTYAAGRGMEAEAQHGRRKTWMLSAVAVLVGVLTLFKASAFLRDALARMTAHPIFELVMPLGISYYTFKLLSYLLDVYWEKIPVERGFIRFAAYVAFFPQIVAGPIQRAETFLPELDQAPPAHFRVVLLGVQRILLGLFKKFVVADNLGLLVDFVYGHVLNHGTPVILGFYAYPLQIYADFSGLADIAIGAAWLLGIETPENFNAPYAAPNITEFWRRWHMTLTHWLGDYVFTPLRMSTRDFGNVGLVISVSVNMILIALWHGFRWTFLAFGIVHAIYLSIDVLTARTRKRYYKAHPDAQRRAKWLGAILTFHLVAVAFVFFRAETIRDAFYCLAHLFQGIRTPSAEFGTYLHYVGLPILAGFWAYAIAEFFDYWRRHNERGKLVFALPRWARWSIYSSTAACTAVLILLMFVSGQTSAPFLYAIF